MLSDVGGVLIHGKKPNATTFVPQVTQRVRIRTVVAYSPFDHSKIRHYVSVDDGESHVPVAVYVWHFVHVFRQQRSTFGIEHLHLDVRNLHQCSTRFVV